MKTLDDFNMKSKKPWEVEEIEWKEIKLDKIAKLTSGGTPSRRVNIYWENGNIPWVKSAELKDNIIYTTEEKISSEGLKNSSAKIFPKGTLLVALYGANVGKIGILGIDAATNQAVCAILPKLHQEKIWDTRFLFHFFTYIRPHLIYKSKGGAQPNIYIHTLKNLKIPIPFRNGKPDLETQKKIVEHIERNFSRIDKILGKKKKELEKLDELWESVLEQAFKPKEGEEWREARLGEVAYIESGNRPKGGVKKYTDGIPSIGGEHLSYDGTFSFEKLKYIPEDFYEQSNKGKIKKYDILIVKDGATTGKTAFVDDNFPFKKAMVNEHVFLCRISEERIYPKFVFRFLMSGEGQNRILKTKGGTAQGGINKRFSKLVKIPIPFRNNQPDLEKQKEIANYLDSTYEKIKILKEKIQKQINMLEEMKESILDEVFNHDEAG